MEKKYYAFAEHETIQAMLHSLFRFQSLEQAQLITNRLATEFTLAPKLSDPLNKKAFVMWVRDLEVTPEERAKGHLGNFGTISIVHLPTGKWTLTLAKLAVPLNKHPLRKAIPRRHPNMGHPVMRAAMRKKTWATMQEAAAQLMKLHEEFPEISVPGLNKLKILTYVRSEKGKPPVQRLELQVVKRDEGNYIIDIRSNLRKPKSPPPPVVSSQQPQDDEPENAVATETKSSDAPKEKVAAEKAGTPASQGFYTNLVAKGRKKKKK